MIHGHTRRKHFSKNLKTWNMIGKAWGVSPPMALLKCRMALSSAIAHSCNFAFSSIFLGPLNTQKDFFWLNWGIQTCLTYLLSKIITYIIIFKNWPNQYFFKLMNTRLKLGAFAHDSFIFKKEKGKPPSSSFQKKGYHQDFQKSCIHLKLGAFGFTSSK